jgi:hypothetical protein
MKAHWITASQAPRAGNEAVGVGQVAPVRINALAGQGRRALFRAGDAQH